MTKSDLITAVAAKARTTNAAAEEIVNLVFDSMKQALFRGERIEIRGFASFNVKNYPGYVGRNPKNGEAIEVRPKRMPVFKVGKELVRRVNS